MNESKIPFALLKPMLLFMNMTLGNFSNPALCVVALKLICQTKSFWYVSSEVDPVQA